MTRRRVPADAADSAGLVEMRTARQTGLRVGIYDGEAAGMDTDAGRWQTVCETHGTVIAHTTLALARSHLSDPLGWCEECREAKERAS